MYTNTRFGELMKGIPRGMFERLAKKHQADKYSKGLRCWDQFAAMLYGQVTGSRSLRDLELSFNSHEGHHYHLGARTIRRSTLADANNKRDVAVYGKITPSNVPDLNDARQMKIEAGATYVFDKGYYDFNSDEAVRFKNRRPGGGRINEYINPLRRVTLYREDHDTPLVLLTNDFNRSAEEVAALYKQRWQIELFFKWLKQNLKIKRFLGRSENAVKPQIYIEIIAYVLLWLYRKAEGMGRSLTDCARLLAAGAFQRPASEYRMWKRRRQQRKELLARQGILI